MNNIRAYRFLRKNSSFKPGTADVARSYAALKPNQAGFFPIELMKALDLTRYGQQTQECWRLEILWNALETPIPTLEKFIVVHRIGAEKVRRPDGCNFLAMVAAFVIGEVSFVINANWRIF